MVGRGRKREQALSVYQRRRNLLGRGWTIERKCLARHDRPGISFSRRIAEVLISHFVALRAFCRAINLSRAFLGHSASVRSIHISSAVGRAFKAVNSSIRVLFAVAGVKR